MFIQIHRVRGHSIHPELLNTDHIVKITIAEQPEQFEGYRYQSTIVTTLGSIDVAQTLMEIRELMTAPEATSRRGERAAETGPMGYLSAQEEIVRQADEEAR